MERNKTMKGRSGQRGALALAAALAILLLSTIAAVAWTKSVGALSGSGAQSATGDRLEDAAKAGVEWARVQARSERCQASSTFTGANAIPGHQDATVTVTCNKVANGATTVYEVVSTACTESSCPSAVPPAGYAEKTARAQFPVVPVAATEKHKDAFIEWLLRYSPARLFDLDQNYLETVVVQATDAMPDPVLYLKMDGTDGAGVFTDSSSSAKAVAKYGYPTTSGASFVNGGSSALYPGSAMSYLSLSSSQDFNLSSGDFTIEFWAKPFLPTSGWNRVLAAGANGSLSSWQLDFQTDGSLGFGLEYYPANGVRCAAGTIKSGKWQHVAVTLTGTKASIYVDGASCGTVTNFTRPSNTAIPLYVGIDASIGLAAGQVSYAGFIDDVRITKAVKWYSDFSTGEVPDQANKAILLDMKFDGPSNGQSFVDSSAYHHFTGYTGNARTYNGTYNSATLGSSVYLDGSSDVRVDATSWMNLGSSNFTIQFWFKTSSSQMYGGLLSRHACAASCTNYWGAGDFDIFLGNGQPQIWWKDYADAPFLISNAGGFNNNAWHHLAWVRNGNVHTLYIDGISRASVTTAVAMSAPAAASVLAVGNDYAFSGRYVAGYYEELQITKGTALYSTSFVPPQAPDIEDGRILQLDFEGANGSQSFTDSSLDGRPAVVSGTPSVTTATFANGNSSGWFDGASQISYYLPYSQATDLNFGITDLTVHGWVRFSSASMGREACVLDGGSGSLVVCKSPENRIFVGSVGHYLSYNSGPVVQADTWTHFAWVRYRGQNQLYINGVSAFSVYDAYAISNPTTFTVGARAGGSSYMAGFIDDLRVVRARGLWTANFVPPRNQASPAKTAVLLHFDETAGSASFADSSASPKTVSAVGTPAASYAHAKFGGSGYFGAGQATVPNSSDLDFSVGDFTVDFHALPNAGGTASVLAAYGWSGAGVAPWAIMRAADGSVSFYAASGNSSWDISNGQPMGTAADNSWTHLAVTRKSGQFYLFNNGRLVTTFSSAAGMAVGTNPLSVGGPFSGASMRFNGYVDEFRVINGKAVWTDAFVPPLRPYQFDGSWSYVPVWEKSGFKNGAAAGLPDQVTRDTVKGFEFSAGQWVDGAPILSGELSGASVIALARPDSSTANSSSAWQRVLDAAAADNSMSAWLGMSHANDATGFAAGTGDTSGQWDAAQSSSGTFMPDAWGLFSATYTQSGTVSLKKDGISVGTKSSYTLPAQDRTSVRIANGSYGDAAGQFTGTLGAVAVFGTPLSDTVLQNIAAGLLTGALPTELRFRSDDSTVTDRVGHPVTVTGTTADASGQGIGPSWVLPGGQRITVNTADISPGTGDFSYEAWIKPASLSSAAGWVSIFDLGTDGTRADGLTLYIKPTGQLASWTNGADVLVTNLVPAIGKWNRVSLRRKSGLLTITLNGVSSSSVPLSANLANKNLNIGSANSSNDPMASAGLSGMMRDVRVWIGVAP